MSGRHGRSDDETTQQAYYGTGDPGSAPRQAGHREPEAAVGHRQAAAPTYPPTDHPAAAERPAMPYQPPMGPGYGAPPGAAPGADAYGGAYGPPLASPQKKRKKWPWILAGAFALIVLVGNIMSAGENTPAAPATAPAVAPAVAPAPAFAGAPPAAPAPSSPVAAPPKRVKLPDVSGQNGAIVFEQLQQLGLTKFQLASRDEDDKFVVNPANWTAVKIAPRSGTEVMSDQTVVVTMTKEE